MAAASAVVDPLRAYLPSVSSGSILLGLLLLVSCRQPLFDGESFGTLTRIIAAHHPPHCGQCCL